MFVNVLIVKWYSHYPDGFSCFVSSTEILAIYWKKWSLAVWLPRKLATEQRKLWDYSKYVLMPIFWPTIFLPSQLDKFKLYEQLLNLRNQEKQQLFTLLVPWAVCESVVEMRELACTIPTLVFYPRTACEKEGKREANHTAGFKLFWRNTQNSLFFWSKFSEILGTSFLRNVSTHYI